MASPPSPYITPPPWAKTLHWSTTPPFEIEWIVKTPCRFGKVGHLKNNLNDGQAVLVGRDGQEIEAECGKRLCEEMEENASEEGGA